MRTKLNTGQPEANLCQTPPYALDPLLPYLDPSWTIWEPAAGKGYLVSGLNRRGFKNVVYGDILTGQDFFTYKPDSYDCIITNPPYSPGLIKYRWLKRCYELGQPFALLMPTETQSAEKAIRLFLKYGFEIIQMTPRVNFETVNTSLEESNTHTPTAWFTWKLNIGQTLTPVILKPYSEKCQLNLLGTPAPAAVPRNPVVYANQLQLKMEMSA